MAISKPGIVSLILGLLIVLGVWYFGFQGQGIMALITTTIIGGIVLLGAFLMLIGLLMLII